MKKENILVLDDFEVSQHYFHTLFRIYKYAFEAFSGADTPYLSDSLQSILNTIDSFRLKHYFQEISDDVKPVVVDSTNSGLPFKGEIKFIESDKENLSNNDDIATLKENIIDSCLIKRDIPIEQMKALSDKLYFNSLEKKVFLSENPPVYQIKDDNSAQLFWSFWCGVSNQPVVYILDIESDKEEKISETLGCIADSIKDFIYLNCGANVILLNIIKSFDEKFNDISPKKLTRYHLGSVYIEGITDHADEIELVLKSVNNDDEKWLFSWSMEEIYSTGEEYVKDGLFSSVKRQKFHIPHLDLDCSKHGCSVIKSYVIIPYSAYQALVEHGTEILNKSSKYVIDRKNNIVVL